MKELAGERGGGRRKEGGEGEGERREERGREKGGRGGGGGGRKEGGEGEGGVSHSTHLHIYVDGYSKLHILYTLITHRSMCVCPYISYPIGDDGPVKPCLPEGDQDVGGLQ